MECKYCKKFVKSAAGIGSHSRKCQEYQNFINSITKEKLEELYYNKQMSAEEIKIFFGFSHQSIINRLFKKFNIRKRTCSESALLCRPKKEKTNIEKYGYKHNFCKNSPSRNQWEQKLLEEEGITNVFQRSSVKKKILKTLIKKYGVESSGKITTSRGKNVYSSIHKMVVEILTDLNIKPLIEFKLKRNSNKYFSYDIIIDNTNKIIEVNGDYWHGNPKIYKKTDVILKGSSKEICVGDKWKFDRKKINHAIKHGYEVLVIWELDLKTDYENTKNRILQYAKTQN